MVKIYYLFALLLFCCKTSYCQYESGEIGWMFDEFPQFSGDIIRFVHDEIIYPESALKDSINGTVFIQYEIDTLGFTINHKIVKGVRNDIDMEALRVSKLIKYEKPAKLNGRSIIFNFTIPIKFELTNKDKKYNDCIEKVKKEP